MALIKCFECKKQISDLAAACPSCGAPIKATPEKSTGKPVPENGGAYQSADGRWAYKDMRFSSHEAAMLYAQSRTEKGASTGVIATASTGLPMWFKLFGAAIALIALFSCIGSGGNSASSGSNAASNFDSTDALTLCQMTLKKASRDPEKAKVPYVENHGSGNEFYFAWGASTKMARMKNDLGLEIATSASCIVSKSQKRITSLTLDGKTIL